MDQKVSKKYIVYTALLTFFVFIVSIVVLSIVGLAPETLTFNNDNNEPLVQNFEEIIDITSDSYTRPDRIIIDKVGINSVINQPNSPDVNALDQALLSGAVHYPGSGSVERGNMFIFGHSTNWSVVQNKAYKTFNNLEKLVEGDSIIVEADGRTYIYKVRSVELVNEDDALVTFDSSKRTLTLSTCNTFGQKQERWVVGAEFERVL